MVKHKDLAGGLKIRGWVRPAKQYRKSGSFVKEAATQVCDNTDDEDNDFVKGTSINLWIGILHP